MFEMSPRFESIAFREFREIGNFSEKKRDAGFEPGEHSQLHRLRHQAAVGARPGQPQEEQLGGSEDHPGRLHQDLPQ